MASGGQDVEDVLKTYVERSATDGMLKLSPVMKCFDAAKLSKYKNTLESSVWVKHQNAGKKVTVKDVAGKVIDDVGAFYVARQKSLKDKAPMTDPDVIKAVDEIRNGIANLKSAPKATAKVDETTKRLTDTSKYTGSHKERFDGEGKGKGIDGRKDLAANDGFVGGYKNKGTYDKK